MSRDIVYEVSSLLPEPVKISIKKELEISEDIDGEIDKASSTLGFYSVLAEKAETRYQKFKLKFDIWEAEEKRRIDFERNEEGLKKLTISQMDDAVRSQIIYKDLKNKILHLEEQKRILKVIAKAFEIKSELVRTKAANRRKEHRR